MSACFKFRLFSDMYLSIYTTRQLPWGPTVGVFMHFSSFAIPTVHVLAKISEFITRARQRYSNEILSLDCEHVRMEKSQVSTNI